MTLAALSKKALLQASGAAAREAKLAFQSIRTIGADLLAIPVTHPHAFLASASTQVQAAATTFNQCNLTCMYSLK